MLRLKALADPELRDRVTPDTLNVAPALLGAPLARPGRRLLAITIDVIVVALLSNIGNLWLLAGLALPMWMDLHERDAELSPGKRRLGWLLAIALLALGGYEAWTDDETPHHARHKGLTISGSPQRDDATTADSPASGSATSGITINGKPLVLNGSTSTPEQTADRIKAERIGELEAQIASLRERKPFDPVHWVREWADDVGLGLGWAIVYFSLLPVWWNGQTVGKRLLRLRVVELTGRPHTAMLAFKRYGGYAAGLATGMFGFLQVLWDPNRQAIQDKTAHTVVIDLRRRLAGTSMNPEETR